MKKSTKIILGTTIPAVAIAAIVPTVVVLTKKNPTPTEPAEIDISDVEKELYSVVERKFDTHGYCYVANIKVDKGSYTDLKAELINVAGITSQTTYEATVIPGYKDNYCMVEVTFYSDELIVTNAPRFDVKLTNSAGKKWIIEGCTGCFTYDSVSLSGTKFNSNQNYYTSQAASSKSFFIRGSVSGMVETWYGSRSIVDWSGFNISAKILNPTKTTIKAELVPRWSACAILVNVDNITSETENLTVQFIVTHDKLPNWQWDFDPLSICLKTNTTESPFKFELNTGKTEAIVKDVYSIDDEITIPNEYTDENGDKYPVKTIGSYALSTYVNLKTVHLPNTLTTIKDFAFRECYYLQNIEIPASVTSIDEDAFEKCYSIDNFTVADDNETYSSKIDDKQTNCLLNKAGTKLLFGFTNTSIPEGITELGDNCFKDSMCLKDVTIPASIKTIGKQTFYGSSVESITLDENSPLTSLNTGFAMKCESLKTVNLTNKLTDLGTRAFCDCTGLEVFTIPNGVTSVGQWCFDGCTNLKQLTIGKSLSWYSAYSLNNCPNIEKFIIHEQNHNFTTQVDGKEYHALMNGSTLLKATSLCTEMPNLSTIGEYAFESKTSLGSFVIPDSVTEIGESAFQGCTGLKELKIGSGVKRINFKAFNSCTNLKEVTIPKSCNYMWNLAFQYCYSLETVKFEEGCELTAIPYHCFDGCESLKNVTLHEGLTEIGDFCFNECASLESITLPSTLTKLNSDSFRACTSLKSITIPKSVTTIDSSSFGECISLKNITFEEDSQLTTLDGDVFSNCVSLNNVVIPAGVTTAKEYLFENCKSLTSVTFKGDIDTVENNCFENCTALEKLTLPDTVETFEDEAFSGCTALKEIKMPSSLTTIYPLAFYECWSLESITIPASVTFIGSLAFQYCDKLTSATFEDKNKWYYSDSTAVDVSNDTLGAQVLLEGWALIKSSE